jgi:hypothetical protein
MAAGKLQEFDCALRMIKLGHPVGQGEQMCPIAIDGDRLAGTRVEDIRVEGMRIGDARGADADQSRPSATRMAAPPLDRRAKLKPTRHDNRHDWSRPMGDDAVTMAAIPLSSAAGLAAGYMQANTCA